MQPDLLQQLRDIHLPLDPSWWPPAPGWWLLGLLLVAALVHLIRLLVASIKRQRPLKDARRLYATLYVNFRKGLLEPEEFLHQANEMLKRTVIHGLGDDSARKANDLIWLKILDARHGSVEFSEGPGRVLGNQRFRENPQADIDALDRLIEGFLKQVRA